MWRIKFWKENTNIFLKTYTVILQGESLPNNSFLQSVKCVLGNKCSFSIVYLLIIKSRRKEHNKGKIILKLFGRTKNMFRIQINASARRQFFRIFPKYFFLEYRDSCWRGPWSCTCSSPPSSRIWCDQMFRFIFLLTGVFI